jgi:hypothetical protein
MRESAFDSGEAGIRSPGGVHDGVVTAVAVLCAGFAQDGAPDGRADPPELERAVARLVGRLLVWFAAEDRGVLHPAGASEQARRRYRRDFSARRLRQASAGALDRAPGGRWEPVRLILDGLGSPEGLPRLGLPGLGGIFTETAADHVLRGRPLADEHLLAAAGSLAGLQDLDSGELGAICCSLLDPAARPGLPGGYYTPAALVDCLLDTALEPVLDAAGECAQAEKALLSVTVCDPACGSGQFLVAAARRIAKRVASAREHHQEPSAGALRRALRDAAVSCVYGVDRSGAAVEVAKACLWLECAEPGTPLSFLDGHVKQGNSLIGVTPGLMGAGIPDSAFTLAEGDDPKFTRSLRRANVRPGPGQVTLFSDQAGAAGADEVLVADAWCAAFTWVKRPDGPRPLVSRGFADLRERGPAGILPDTLAEIGRLREEHGFFHWHLEFPDVFAHGGFSCVLVNPPWDKVDRRGDRAAFGFARGSGAYPECAAGLAARGVTALRADQLFIERLAAITAPAGQAGGVVPAAIANGPGPLFGSLARRGAVASLYGFEGRGAPFCLLTLVGAGSRVDAPRYAFALRDPAELAADGRAFTLTAAEVALISPNTGSLPAFRDRRAAALATAVYRRVPVLLDEARADGNPWKMRLAPGSVRIRNDPGVFRTADALREEGWELDGSVFTRGPERMLGVYEAAMAHHFDHRHGQPRYWVAEDGPGAGRLRELGWARGWLCGWRESHRPDDERTTVAAFLPRAPVTESFPLMLPRAVPPFVAALIAAQSSLVFDFVAGQKLGGAPLLPAAWKQLPVPTPRVLEPHLPFLVPRVLELAYTADEMAPLARDLDDDGDPFAWDPGRRAELRAELDAFFFRLYGIDDRGDVAYILESFPAEAGQLVLSAYDRMAAADADGSAYETRIIPSPGHGRRAERGEA